MSQDNELDPYYQEGVRDVEHRNIGKAGDGHPFGNEPKPFEANLQSFISEISDDLYDSWEMTIREYLANAETACLKVKQYAENPESSPYDDMTVDDSYNPVITVTWNKAREKLTIADNGIGMAAVEVDQVFRHIGRSGARDIGSMSGAFGMGALSFPKFIGKNSSMVMLSNSRLAEDNAAYLVSLAGVEPIMGSLDDTEYGTKFKLDQKESDMDIRSAVKKYSQNLRVPVIYRELDENESETFNDDYGGRNLYDDYNKDAFADWIVKPGAFAAYTSPDATGETLLLSMEIDRNNTGSNRSRYEYDIRILDESGTVIKSTNGNEGLIPVNRVEYNDMLLNERDEYITESLLSNTDVVATVVESDVADYAIDSDILHSDEPLPLGDYFAREDVPDDQLGEDVVIIGKHDGRTVVSEETWNSLPEGRASNFVPEDELESFDVSSGEGDLCLPTPTTDRSSLQSNDAFWEYIEQTFAQNFDESIDKWRKILKETDDTGKAIREMDEQTAADLEDVNAW